ncbi:MAG: aldehyde dehydrogenase [Sulfobacillus thermosulfidooxidans]|uniref:aldehyde dehydrogenase (NAD(+)) n=1 Tax=Sulfobacillus thermotolerans TaxID=338644 RepID=A0ABN5H2K7_9FIRM|nr:aldehyde dehydrogenase family protein [Sulfobacillus sp. hq2]AUW94592.1 aldehyde dehydrogenase [Sulfobacillus thermotolerans]MCY0909675.1 aldehyde dehydrogenase family protein [Sulfobacillus thermotolerans]POB09116.1 aldehyde dehydrogenase [Sulfobacillus sp. hq2]PSR35895.1 MAG: aldehyde dehydrogenase [Sulfobacillus thermosulfidooxidans]
MRLLNFIDGQWVAPTNGIFQEDYDPATGEVLLEVPRSSREDTERAIAAAKRAFKTWRLVPAPKRGEILFRVGQILMDRKMDLARDMTREMGKVQVEAMGDVQEGIDMAFYMAGEGRRSFGYTTPSELPDKFAMAVRDPIGVAGIITPWNFPMAIPTWKMFPALVAGNTVVFKPASETPHLAYHLVKILQEAGVPDGVVNLVFGSGQEVGETLITHPDVALISFTGSNETGRHVAQVAGAGLKRVSLELGGKNAIIVMDDADLDLAVDGIIWSAFGTTGQRCTACSRLIVHEAVYGALRDRLKERIATLKLGSGLDQQTDVGPLINRQALEKVHRYVKIGQDEGAHLEIGGQIAADPALQGGNFYLPTLFTDVTMDMRIAQEEIFGPVLSMIRVRSLEEAIAANNQVTYGLSSSIFTQNVNRTFQAIRDLATGIVYINAGTTGAEIHLPFGGTRGTGNGHREAGTAALDFFSEWKAVYVDFSGKLQRAQIDD